MIDPGTLMHLTPDAADRGLRTAADARSGAGRGAGSRDSDDGGFTSALSGAMARAGRRDDAEGDVLVADADGADATDAAAGTGGATGAAASDADIADADALLDELVADGADSSAVGLAATIAALLQARADLADGAATPGEAGTDEVPGELLDAIAADLVDAVLADGGQIEGATVEGAALDGAPLDGILVDGVLVDAALVDGVVVDGVLVDGVVAGGVLVDGEPADAIVVDGELVNGELNDAVIVEAGAVGGVPVDGVPVDGEPVDGVPVDGEPVEGEPVDSAPVDGDTATDSPAGDAPVAAPVEGEDATSEDAGTGTDGEDAADGDEVLTVPTDGAAAQRADRAGTVARDGQRVDGPAAEGNRYGRSAEVRQDAFAPGQERSARPDATRATTQADANRIPVGVQTAAADMAAEAARTAVRDAAGRQVTLPPALQRIVDVASQLENAPPPRQLTLDLGEVRVRVSLDDGGLRLTQLSGNRDVGDDILREAAELLQERGFDLAGDGEQSDARDDDSGSERAAAVDPDTDRRARRGGLRL